MNEERIREVFSDEEFVSELLTKETPEEAQALLVEKDIDVSVEDLIKIKDIMIKKVEAAENGESYELTEDELADIAGGEVVALIVMGVFLVGITAKLVHTAKGVRLRW